MGKSNILRFKGKFKEQNTLSNGRSNFYAKSLNMKFLYLFEYLSLVFTLFEKRAILPLRLGCNHSDALRSYRVSLMQVLCSTAKYEEPFHSDQQKNNLNIRNMSGSPDEPRARKPARTVLLCPFLFVPVLYRTLLLHAFLPVRSCLPCAKCD